MSDAMPWRFVERAAELTVLDAAMRNAMGGQGRFVVVEGAAGLGKTSLAREAAAAAEKAGFRVLSGRGVELEREYPFGVARQLFTPALERIGPAERRKATSAGAAVAVSALGIGGPDGPVAAVGEFAVLHGLYWLTANLSQARPLMLMIDDLHWVDMSSLRFLAHVLPRLEDIPVLLLGTVRRNEPGPYRRMIEQITTDPACVSLRLGPLSEESARRLVSAAVGEHADADFVRACCAAAEGNPLFLRELMRAVDAERVAPSRANVGRVRRLGQRAVARSVAVRLAQLPAPVVRLTRAMAVLGEGADLAVAARLAQMPLADAGQAAILLRGVEILRVADSAGPAERWEFVHPLVRDAVYGAMDPAERTAHHTRAARLLRGEAASTEKIAGHLLWSLPGGDPDAPAVLRAAAAGAAARGALPGALAYLRRCLAEPLDQAERHAVLLDAGAAAMGVDPAEAAEHLDAAMAGAADPRHRASIAVHRGMALWIVGRAEETAAVLRQAMEGLPEDDPDLRRRLAALMLNIPLCLTGWSHLLDTVPDLRRLPPADTVGARMLNMMIACIEVFDGDPRGVEAALEAVTDGWLDREAGTGMGVAQAAAMMLLTGDVEAGMGFVDAGLAESYLKGSVVEATAHHAYRMIGWLFRGDLAAAAADAGEAMRGIEENGLDTARPSVAGHFAEVLVERGEPARAQAVLDWGEAPPVIRSTGLTFWYVQQGRARVARARGQHAEALEAALEAGERFAASGGRNPALVAWRSEAALCLRSLGRAEEARDHARTEVELARRWGAPRALGRALRVAGVVAGGEQGLEMLREAVDVLRPSSARLEYAKSLTGLGAALFRCGRTGEAQEALREGMALAESCGAEPLADSARAVLRDTGVRPPRKSASGMEALTPSERRVAGLAAAGSSNRDIAELLFVLPKTVEVHLTSVYRKLGVKGRAELAARYPDPPRNP
ncbi:AAA family ATPase [Sphaerisporangium sp. B11E5]|uniref:helix-turn-helix transcriptional regulator n=1 Tax=Sphaerisporangium sp. B11E5 TaxID=3153563 RepID=UPI00325F64A7